jgi:hypothetical protein
VLKQGVAGENTFWPGKDGLSLIGQLKWRQFGFNG